jgi:CRP-like cAMP-binding protein
LLHLAQLQSEDNCSVSLSQSELAEYVGATREAVSKTISVWKKQGIIEASRGGLEILDSDTMEELADPEQI